MRFTIIKTATGYQKIAYNDTTTKEKRPKVMEDVLDKDVIAILKNCYLKKIKTIECSKLVSQAFQFNTKNKTFYLIIRHLSDKGSGVSKLRIAYTDVGFTKELLESIKVNDYE